VRQKGKNNFLCSSNTHCVIVFSPDAVVSMSGKARDFVREDLKFLGWIFFWWADFDDYGWSNLTANFLKFRRSLIL
jgi:hypothetical protein